MAEKMVFKKTSLKVVITGIISIVYIAIMNHYPKWMTNNSLMTSLIPVLNLDSGNSRQ